jgi:hypothetical protein
MRTLLLAASLLALTVPLAGCMRSLDEQDVREFIDKADDAARKRYAPEICELRGENFTLEVSFQSLDDNDEPNAMKIDRKLFCRETGRFSRLRQYQLERKSLAIDVDDDGKTAQVTAEYLETMPYYADGTMPTTPDDFRDFVLVESHDVSTVGIESGGLVFLNAKVSAEQVELVPKNKLNLPYD